MLEKATKDQIRYLSAVGALNDENITKAQAAKLIEELEEQGLEPDWSLADECLKKMTLKKKGKLSREIKALEQKQISRILIAKHKLRPQHQAKIKKRSLQFTFLFCSWSSSL